MLRFFELNSIRSRMVSGFLFLTFLILVLSLVSMYIMESTSRTARFHGKISQLEIYSLSLIKYDNDFFDLETINENYFKTKESKILHARDSLHAAIKVELAGLMREARKNRIEGNLRSIDSTLIIYNQKFLTLVKLVLRKGFKDDGLEGEMRHHAHELESTGTKLEIMDVLYLRRHEKDFFLRHDTIYIASFLKRYDQLYAKLTSAKENKATIEHLQKYKERFMELADIQKTLGITSNAGLRSELNVITNSLSQQYYKLSNYSYEMSLAAEDNGRIFYLLMLIGAIFFSLLSGYWISKRLSEPIARLSNLVEDSLRSRSDKKTDFTLPNAANEINTLTNSFILLMNQAREQMSDIKEKSRELRQKNKQLRALNRELDNFLYSTAHDLRSPLASLLGLINLMRFENNGGNTPEYLDRMEKSIHRSEYFISQIVNYSKNKRMQIHPEPLDLRILIDEILDQHSFVEGFERIEKTVSIIDHDIFYSDKNRVIILLNNFISNGIRYYDPMKAHSFISIVVTTDMKETVIEFSDNGIGIAQEHIKKIFDMFYRADLKSKGSGLGLFIVRETVKRLNGSINVQSFPGQGTTFTVRIPNLKSEVIKQQMTEHEAQPA